MSWESENPLLEYVEYGLTPAEAVDYYATEIEGFTQEEWAALRRLEGHQSVGRNVRVAREKIGDGTSNRASENLSRHNSGGKHE